MDTHGVTSIEYKVLVEMYQKLETEHKQLQEKYDDARQRYEGCQRQYNELLVKYYAMETLKNGMLIGIDQLKQEIQRLKGELGEMESLPLITTSQN